MEASDKPEDKGYKEGRQHAVSVMALMWADRLAHELKEI
jgi:hypothetical protein